MSVRELVVGQAGVEKNGWPAFIRLFYRDLSRLRKPRINHKQSLEINLLHVVIKTLSSVLNCAESFHESYWTLYWGKLINTYIAVMSGSITQFCWLLLLKCISVGLLAPVIVFYCATVHFLYVFPCHFCFISIFSSHIYFCFLYLAHPTLGLVSLPSFPVHCFCLSCFWQTNVYNQKPCSSTFISLFDFEIIPRRASLVVYLWQTISKSHTISFS